MIDEGYLPVHEDDGRRIEEALDALGYLMCRWPSSPDRNDGPNGWVFGQSASEPTGPTWYTRFFGTL